MTNVPNFEMRAKTVEVVFETGCEVTVRRVLRAHLAETMRSKTQLLGVK